MRLKKSTRVSVEQVRIAREGNGAIVDHADAGISGAHLAIGPEIATMTDAEIVDLYNGILESQHRLLAEWDKTVIEEPLGEKQIDYHEDSDQWVPRGDVLRCVIDDGGPEGEVTIHIDDKELSLAEFGRMLTVHAGWGMRIAFVPEEFICENQRSKSESPSGGSADVAQHRRRLSVEIQAAGLGLALDWHRTVKRWNTPKTFERPVA
jgi:hypothetical protein